MNQEAVILAVIVVAAVILLAGWWASRRAPADVERVYVVAADGRIEGLDLPTLEWGGRYEYEVVGESHYRNDLEAICGGKSADGDGVDMKINAVIFRDKDNEHDPNAVVVTINQKRVGYLSRGDARDFRKKFRGAELAWYVPARIVGGFDNGDGKPRLYGVKLDLPLLGAGE